MDAAVFLPWSPKKSTLTHKLGCIHRMHTVHLQANCLTEESVHVRMHMCMHGHMHMCMHPQLWKFSLDFHEHTAEASLQSPLPAQETASAKTNTGWLCVHLCICASVCCAKYYFVSTCEIMHMHLCMCMLFYEQDSFPKMWKVTNTILCFILILPVSSLLSASSVL